MRSSCCRARAQDYSGSSHHRNDWQILDERGTPGFVMRGGFAFHTATLAPGGGGVLVVYGASWSADVGGGIEIEARTFDLDGSPGPGIDLGRAEVQGADGTRATSATRHGQAFVSTSLGGGETVLVALEGDHDGLRERWRIGIPPRHVLLQDADGRDAAVQTDDGDTIALVALGPEPPSIPSRDVDWQDLPDLHLERACQWRSDAQARHAAVFESVLRLLDGAFVADRIDAWLGARTPPVESLDDIVALARCQLPRRTRAALIEVAERAFAGEPLACLLVADHRVHRGEHADALRLLEAVDARALEPGAAQHAQHLTALCRLALGATREAQAACKRAKRRVRGCGDLADLAAYLDALRATAPTDPRRVRGASLASFVGRLRAADRELARGDGAAALRFLEHPSVWAIRHLQCTVRLAEAWLLRRPIDAPGSFRAREVLAEPLDQHAGGLATNAGRELGELAWPAARIRRTIERAAAWLGSTAVVAGTRQPEPPEPPEPLEPPEPERPYPPPGALIETMVRTPSRALRAATPLEGAVYRDRLRRHAPALSDALGTFRGPRRAHQLAGLVVDADHPDAPAFRTAAERLLDLPQPDADTVLPVAFESIFALLSEWPAVYQRFLQHLEETRASFAPPSVLLCRNGAGFGVLGA